MAKLEIHFEKQRWGRKWVITLVALLLPILAEMITKEITPLVALLATLGVVAAGLGALTYEDTTRMKAEAEVQKALALKQ